MGNDEALTWMPDCTEAELDKARAALQRDVDSQPVGGKWRVLQHREWQDEYPDTITVSVQVGQPEGRAMVVVSAGTVWLAPDQVTEVRAYLGECSALAGLFNAAHLDQETGTQEELAADELTALGREMGLQ